MSQNDAELAQECIDIAVYLLSGINAGPSDRAVRFRMKAAADKLIVVSNSGEDGKE